MGPHRTRSFLQAHLLSHLENFLLFCTRDTPKKWLYRQRRRWQLPRGSREGIKMNAPDRFTQFLLEAGQKKITWELDTRVANTAIFTFNKEDHTPGNLITQRLHKYKFIQFSAYRVPHPLFATFDLRVTTDGSISPKDAILKACQDCITDLGTLSREFTKEWELKKIAGEHGGGMDPF